MNETPNLPPDYDANAQPSHWGVVTDQPVAPMNTEFPPPHSYYAQPFGDARLDPDQPRWGVLGGLGVWISSVAALVIVPSIAVVAWYFIEQIRGANVPLTADEIARWAMTPRLILVQIVSSIGAHLVTLAICWAVATGMGKRPLSEAIGWQWEGPSPIAKIGIVIGVVVLSIAVMSLLPRLLPDSKETPFSQILKASKAVRYVVAFLAVFTAPLVEEFVYRGLLYSPLRKAIGMAGAVSTATILFALVHVPQYWGAWASLTGLLLLSFSLTVIRAKTKSIFPCVMIHMLFNLVGAIGIILGSDG
ncbi:MAG: CPBP family intramembrane metalloprotease [Acidobacteria bacterium]|nr:CPBP family intramembrane metalloprotease [Acidobacteriota bacterium]